MDEMTKFERCRHSFPDLKSEDGKIKVEHKCMKTNSSVTDEQCEGCTSFASRYIEFPIEVSKINIDSTTYDLHSSRVGEYVKIRPCGDDYKGKTYFGILIGDMPISPHASYNRKTKELDITMISNPAIFVPELKKVIYGCESWWGKIESKEDVDNLSISDEDIENVWYVKALKSMFDK